MECPPINSVLKKVVICMYAYNLNATSFTYHLLKNFGSFEKLNFEVMASKVNIYMRPSLQLLCCLVCDQSTTQQKNYKY